MATYIGLNYNTFFEEQNASQSDFSSITSPNSISYSLILTSSTPWTIGGGRYMVYQVAALSDGYTIDSTWFIHSYGGNIGSIDDLPLNSKIVYATSNTGTFSGNGFSTGTLYYSSNSFANPKQSNTWSSETNPGGVAGTSYTYYNKQTSTVSSGKCTNSNFCPTSSYGVSIVELYHSTNGVSNATGLYTSIINKGASQPIWPDGTYKSWIYDYKRTANTGSSYPARINGTERKVFAIHNTTGGDCNLAIAYGGSTSTTLSDTNYTIGAFGYTKVAYNTWAHHTTEGKHYYSITVNKDNQFIETRLQLEAGSAYTIKMHTYSEASYDGIIISTKKLSSFSGQLTSTGEARCSGVDTKVTYTLPSSTSTRTLYIYFRTNQSTLKGPGEVDSGGASISTISNYSTGDVEIYKDNVYVVTFNANGGNFGTVSTKTTNVIVGTSLNLNTVEKPTRGGWKFYGWSVGTGFNFAPNNIYTPKKNVTIYAIWDNFPKFTELSDKSVYCTDDCIAASSTQGSKSIRLFTSGMTCSKGDVTCYTSRSKVYPVGSPNSPISGATIQPVGTDNNVTVPAGTPAGDYIASITVYTSASPASPGSYYGPTSDTPVTYNIPFTIKATTLTYGPVQYMTHTPDGELTNGDITQQKNFPAGQFTISTDNIGEYFTIYGVFKQAVSCNNGTQREGNVTVQGWETLPDYEPGGTTVSSLGTTPTDSYTYTFTFERDGIDGFRYMVRGEGSKWFIKNITSGLRSANALTGISLSLGSSSINYNSTTTATVTAKYTSGSSKDVTDSLSTSPSATSNYIKSGDTSIVTIS